MGPAPGGRRASQRRGRQRAPEPPLVGAAAEDPDADPESVARAVCLRMLTGAARSRAQLAAALAQRNVPDDVAVRVLDRFTEVGLIDDAAYAESFVRSRHQDRGLAGRALRHELRQRGVDDELAESAVSAVDPDAEAAMARRLVRRRLPALRTHDVQSQTRRLAAMLARKGYGPGVSFRVIREELAASGAEGESWAAAEVDPDG